MTFQRFRAALVPLLLTVLALLASACGGSDSPASAVDTDDAAATSSDTGQDSESADGAVDSDDDATADSANEASDDDAAMSDDEAMTDDAMDDDDAMSDDADDAMSDSADTDESESGAIDNAPVPLGDVNMFDNTTTMIRSLFNIDPDPSEVDCVLAESEARPNLAQAIIDDNAVFAQLGDETLIDVTHAVNGCVAPLSLGSWAMEAVGPTGEVRETAPACFAGYFDDPDQGDDLFHIFIALSFQYRYDPIFVPAITDVLVDCAPVTSLATFFANQAEAESNYDTVIDRDCFLSSIDNDEASTAFWSTLIDGQVPPFTVMTPYLAECAEVANAGLADTLPADFVAWSGTGGLAQVAPAARANIYPAPPPMSIDPAGSYEAVFATGGGEVRIRLYADSAPVTVNNFVSLARDGFFDGTVFHRVLDEFMAQGGDPTGTGTGGPGYNFQDETVGGPPLDRPGLLAMANSGPNTNGSQFFITFIDTDWLTGNHTVFGEVTEGMDIVNAIQRRNPDAPEGRGQLLESVTIIEG